MRQFFKSRIIIPLSFGSFATCVTYFIRWTLTSRNELVNGYRKGHRVLHVYPFDKDGNTKDITHADICKKTMVMVLWLIWEHVEKW